MRKGLADNSKATPSLWDRVWRKVHRAAAGLTHAVFALAVVLILVRGGEPRATVKESARLEDRSGAMETTAAAGNAAQSPDGLFPQPEGAANESEPPEAQESEEFQIAQRSRRQRREEREEQPPEPAQPLPTPPRSQADQARANKLMDRL